MTAGMGTVRTGMRWGAAVAAAVWIAGCAPSPGDDESAATGLSDETLSALEGDDASEDEEAVAYAVPIENLITAESIGLVHPGETLGDLQATVGDAPVRVIDSYLTGLSAICVDDDAGAEQLCAAYSETEQPSVDTPIELVVTRHPKFRTKEGVGPGLALEVAESVFGKAYLVYDSRSASREVVEFERGPAGSISFLPFSPSAPDDKVGIYGSTRDGFNETTKYRDDAVIGAVELRAGPKE